MVCVGSRVDFVTEKGLYFLLSLKSRGVFSVKSIEEDFGLKKNEASFIFNRLHKDKIIMKGGEKGEKVNLSDEFLCLLWKLEIEHRTMLRQKSWKTLLRVFAIRDVNA